jgi:FlaA1/EpsC-like NDP-sugar epimerase
MDVSVQDLDAYDLLGREPVFTDLKFLSKNVVNNVVLITGAGGSIGTEICKQIIKFKPSVMVLVEISEYALYIINDKLNNLIDSGYTRIIPILASVVDHSKINEITKKWKPNIIYHIAAYKHVPLVEVNAAAGILNNTFGTKIMADVALENKVEYFTLVSTDKAVRPTNIMGASKRLSEMVLQALSCESPFTKFSIVRFGNVLDSSGSVVPLFRKQIAAGGPITLTHTEVTRYFMTIQEAAELVIQAGFFAEGGEVFVLDMGDSVKIFDLAVRMIELSGLTVKNNSNPYGDIEIKVTGLRPGEKLFEELLIGENVSHTGNDRIFRAIEKFIDPDTLNHVLRKLHIACNENNLETITEVLVECVEGFHPTVCSYKNLAS